MRESHTSVSGVAGYETCDCDIDSMGDDEKKYGDWMRAPAGRRNNARDGATFGHRQEKPSASSSRPKKAVITPQQASPARMEEPVLMEDQQGEDAVNEEAVPPYYCSWKESLARWWSMPWSSLLPWEQMIRPSPPDAYYGTLFPPNVHIGPIWYDYLNARYDAIVAYTSSVSPDQYNHTISFTKNAAINELSSQWDFYFNTGLWNEPKWNFAINKILSSFILYVPPNGNPHTELVNLGSKSTKEYGLKKN